MVATAAVSESNCPSSYNTAANVLYVSGKKNNPDTSNGGRWVTPYLKDLHNYGACNDSDLEKSANFLPGYSYSGVVIANKNVFTGICGFLDDYSWKRVTKYVKKAITDTDWNPMYDDETKNNTKYLCCIDSNKLTDNDDCEDFCGTSTKSLCKEFMKTFCTGSNVTLDGCQSFAHNNSQGDWERYKDEAFNYCSRGSNMSTQWCQSWARTNPSDKMDKIVDDYCHGEGYGIVFCGCVNHDDISTFWETAMPEALKHCASEKCGKQGAYHGQYMQSCENYQVCIQNINSRQTGSITRDLKQEQNCQRLNEKIDDQCDNVACGNNETCYAGICGKACNHSDECEPGSICIDGTCIFDQRCSGIKCPKGFYCRAGICQSNNQCAGVICHQGEHCDAGNCVLDRIVTSTSTNTGVEDITDISYPPLTGGVVDQHKRDEWEKIAGIITTSVGGIVFCTGFMYFQNKNENFFWAFGIGLVLIILGILLLLNII